MSGRWCAVLLRRRLAVGRVLAWRGRRLLVVSALLGWWGLAVRRGIVAVLRRRIMALLRRRVLPVALGGRWFCDLLAVRSRKMGEAMEGCSRP